MTDGSTRAGGADVDRRAIDAVTYVYGGVALLVGVLIARAPLLTLLDRFVPDDAFYYFNTARHFATTGVSTFDGIHFTNGYHPLWFLVSVPVFAVFPDGGEAPLRVMFVLQALLGTAATALMARHVARLFGPALAAAAGVLWIVVMHRVLLNGLETALHTALFALVFTQFLRFVVDRRGAFALGVTSGLLFLSRTDAGFLVALLALWFLLDSRRAGNSRNLVAFALPAFAISGAYLATNLIATGHLMPVSGAAKIYHSDAARTATMTARGESRWGITLWNLWWPVRQHAWWAVVSLSAPIVFFGFLNARLPAKTDPSDRLSITVARETWPFAAGVWIAFLFYGIEFFGGHSSTLWYFPPLVLAAWFYLPAAIAATWRWAPGIPLHAWTAAWIAIGLAFEWLSVSTAAIAAAGAIVTTLLARRLGRWNRAAAAAAVLTTIVVLGWSVAAQHVSLHMWVTVTTFTAIAGGAIVVTRPRFALAHVLAGIVTPALLVHGANLRGDLKAPPANWNYHLYLGAEWARANLPPDATIWSGSAGILGYFSGHRTINTDGLANDYDFLEHVLKAGKTGAYFRQWDYSIDAMGSDLLQQYFPEGCFVPLPPEATAPDFDDGGARRRLRVFKMKCQK